MSEEFDLSHQIVNTPHEAIREVERELAQSLKEPNLQRGLSIHFPHSCTVNPPAPVEVVAISATPELTKTNADTLAYNTEASALIVCNTCGGSGEIWKDRSVWLLPIH